MEQEQIDAMRAIHPDMDPEKPYGGITKLWVKPVDHRHNHLYQWHDVQYDLARIGLIKGPSSELIDLNLLKMMIDADERLYWREIEAAGEILERLAAEMRYAARIAEDYADFLACRVWGGWRWPKEATI